MLRWALTALFSTAGLLLSACGGGSPETLRVDAASSLEPAFAELIQAFPDPGAAIELNVAGSSTLATGIIEGSQPDIFAAADTTTMQRVIDAGLADSPQVFTTNRLALVVPPDDPAQLLDTTPGSLPEALVGSTVAQCAPQVPCGRLSVEAQGALGIAVTPATEEANVRSVLTKVETGEVDAGFVYFTDTRGSDVEIVPVDGLGDFVNRYPIVVLSASKERAANDASAAQRFVDFVLSPEGQEILASWGFVS